MPAVVQDGEFTFVVHTRELPFHPPHVHVWFGGDQIQIALGAGTFMDQLPMGKRRAMLQAFKRHADAIRRSWEAIHGPLEGSQP